MKINHIYNESCINTIKRLPDSSIHMVITSPPYDSMRTYQELTVEIFEELVRGLHRILVDGGVIVWIVGDQTKAGSETGTSFRQALGFIDAGFNLHDTMIWERQPKGAIGNSMNRYYGVFEYMFVISKGKPRVANIIQDRENKRQEGVRPVKRRSRDGTFYYDIKPKTKAFGKRGNIWRCNTGNLPSTSTDKIAYEHPAIFPEQLVKDHILSWSNENDIVYDPFMGSGTTAKVCKMINRRYIGSEISKEYCNIIHRRLGTILDV